MLDIRSPLILAAAPAGLALAAGGWLGLGGGGAALAAIEQQEARSAALPRQRSAAAVGDAATTALAMMTPLFAPLADVQVRLDGLARSPGRSAALIAINNGPPQWVTVGTTVAGVTLTGIGSSRASIETASGPVELALGQTTGPSNVVAAAGPGTIDAAPPGRRGLEPASAPVR